MKKLLFLIILLLPLAVFPQFNDSTNYYVNYTGTGIANKTNDGNAYLLNNCVKFNVYKNQYALNTTNGWIFGEQKHQRSNNDFTSVADLSLFKNERHIYYWALGAFDKSYSLKINHRIQTGAGIGYYAIDKQSFVVELSDGILYENSDLYNTETNSNRFSIARNSFRLKLRLLSKNIFTLDNINYLQHSLADKKDYIVKSTTTLSIKVKKWLSFTSAVNYNKLSVTHRENLTCTFGLTLENYF
jgi:hypothetical protein